MTSSMHRTHWSSPTSANIACFSRLRLARPLMVDLRNFLFFSIFLLFISLGSVRFSNCSHLDSILHDALQSLTFANFSKFLSFCFTRRDVLHFGTLELFCNESVVCDHTHSFNVDVLQLITSSQCFHSCIFPDSGLFVQYKDNHASLFNLMFDDGQQFFHNCTANVLFFTVPDCHDKHAG